MTPINSSVEGGLENGIVLSFFLFWEVGVIEERKRMIPSTLNMESVFLIYPQFQANAPSQYLSQILFSLCLV